MRTSYFQIRLTPEERADIGAGAQRFGTSVTGFVRKAVKSALTQKPALLPEERASLDTTRDQFRRAADNLNSLLRQSYMFQNGTIENGPTGEELTVMAAELRQQMDALTAALKILP